MLGNLKTMNASDIDRNSSLTNNTLVEENCLYPCNQNMLAENCQCCFVNDLSKATIVVEAVTLIVGVVSWSVIKSWRKFRNFVYLNLVFALFFVATTSFQGNGTAFLVLINWLFVGLFVFHYNNRKRRNCAFKIANIFGWCLPHVEDFLIEVFQYNLCNVCRNLLFVLSIFSILLFVKSFLSLVKQLVIKRRFFGWQNFMFSIPNLILSWCLHVFVLRTCFCSERGNIKCECIFYNVLNSVFLVVNLLFLSMRSHRSLWREYFVQRRTRLPT